MNASYALVVVTHDSEADLRRLLASLDAHLRPAPPVIVVDTGSRDASVEVARAAGAQVVLRPDNPGFGAANNAGVAAVAAEVTVLLNPDVELLDDGLARMAAAAAARRALLAPRLLNPDGSAQRTAHPVPGRVEALGAALLGPALPPPLRLRAEPWRGERKRKVGWVIAAAVAARTDVLRRLGPFDPSIFLFYEDMDLCLRARAAGIPCVLVPGVRLVHRGGHSIRPAYGREPFALLAERRRRVVQARLGARAGRLDDLAQGVTFATRIAARRFLGRPAGRERAQLAALRAVRAGRRS